VHFRTCPVALLAAGHLLHFELAVAYEIFGNPPREATEGWYDVLLCGPGPVQVGPFMVKPDHGLERLVGADTVIVSACADIDDPPPAELIEAVRASHESGARVASLCTGAFVLGAAGLLDGRRATTHWAHAAELSARHPRAVVDPDVLYTDNGSVHTAAGKAAAVDLCLHLIHLDHGATIANSVARRLVMPPHRPGGQAQFVATPMQVTTAGPAADGDRHGTEGEHESTQSRTAVPVSDRADTDSMAPDPARTPGPGAARGTTRASRRLPSLPAWVPPRHFGASSNGSSGVPPDSYRRSFRSAKPA
jgi:AraC family transcriptional activator FtrA